MFVARRGEGPPVVALHAIGHGSGDFEPLATRLGARYSLHMIDWPGHGQSLARCPVSAGSYAKLLDEVIPAVLGGETRPILLLGNSIGGAAAIAWSAAHPSRVAGLVLCDPGGLAPIGAFERAAIGGFARFFAAGASGPWWFRRAYAAYYRWVLPAAEARDRRARIVAAGPAMASALAEAWRSFARPEADLRAIAAKLSMPVWLAWSASDHVVPYRKSRAAAERIPLHEHTAFAGGHAPFLECPDDFAEQFSAWVARAVDPRSRAAAA
jgi:4,5:9,10-diseco-3-hydroxy-5,9,17-trioxoandrosta-1(10),2-diene-4-oate hydrolase